MTRYLPPYRDLNTYYPRPGVSVLGSSGWFRQVSHNVELMWNATEVGGGPGNDLGAVEFAPSWVDVTTATDLGVGGYLRVGHLCHFWAGAAISAIGTAGAGIALPVAPADTVLPMVAGAGSIYDASATAPLAFVGVVEGGDMMFYWSTAATDGAVIDTDPITVGPLDRIVVHGHYRTTEPPAGRLSADLYELDEQYPVKPFAI